MRILISVIALLNANFISFAHAESSNQDMFWLWNWCSKVDIYVVYERISGAHHLGLTQESIETTVRSRLRGARIFDAEADDHIEMIIGVYNQAYHIQVSMQKIMNDPLTDLKGPVGTWSVSHLGIHGDNHQYLLGVIGELTDKFIDESWRVNGKACQ